MPAGRMTTSPAFKVNIRPLAPPKRTRPTRSFSGPAQHSATTFCYAAHAPCLPNPLRHTPQKWAARRLAIRIRPRCRALWEAGRTDGRDFCRTYVSTASQTTPTRPFEGWKPSRPPLRVSARRRHWHLYVRSTFLSSLSSWSLNFFRERLGESSEAGPPKLCGTQLRFEPES